MADLAAPWIVPAALVTLAVGAIGVLASRTLVDLVCFSTVWSMGSLLVAVGLFDQGSLTAALYYTLHSTLAGAALFLLTDLVLERRGRWLDALKVSPPIARQGLLAGLFFIGAIAIAGLPPLSGFIGKVLILDATRGSAWAIWIWSIVLGTSLFVLLGLARAGSVVFWKSGADGSAAIPDEPGAGSAWRIAAVASLLALTAFLAVFAGPVTGRMAAAARDLVNPAVYVEAVLGPAAGAVMRARR